MKLETPWIICRNGLAFEPYMLECERCGETQQVPLPISIGAFIKVMKAFIRHHSPCLEPEQHG